MIKLLIVPQLKIVSEVPEHLSVLGINSSQKDYRVAHFLNKTLEIVLKREEDLTMINKRKYESENIFFPFFRFEDELLRLIFYLVKNQSGKIGFIPSLKKTDYLFLADGYESDLYLNEKLGLIKEIPVVEAAYVIPPEKIKNRTNLFFE